MVTVPIYGTSPEVRQLRRTTLDSELDLAMQPDSNDGWPMVNGEYYQVISWERYAASLAIVSNGIPGLLKDESYVEAQFTDVDFTSDRKERMYHLLSSRQRSIESRLADSDDKLKLSLFLPDDVMQEVAQVGREHVAPQAARLLLAVEQGWNIAMVPGATLRKAMGGMNTSLLAADNPGQPMSQLYREYDDREPHESSHYDAVSLAEAARLHCTMAQSALPSPATQAILLRHAGKRLHRPNTAVFDLRGKR